MAYVTISAINDENIKGVFYGLQNTWGTDSHTEFMWEFQLSGNFHVALIAYAIYNIALQDNVGVYLDNPYALYNPEGSNEPDWRYLDYNNTTLNHYVKHFDSKPLYLGYKPKGQNYKFSTFLGNGTMDIEYVAWVRGYIYKDYPVGL